MNWRPIRFSIFTKLVLAFVIVISPLYLLGAIMNQKGSAIIHEDISKSMQQKADFYLLSLETEIERMTVLQREFINDEDLMSLSIMSDRLTVYERLAAMNRLQTRTRFIKESSPYIAEVKAYIPAVERTISSNTAVSVLTREELSRLGQDAEGYIPPLLHSGDRLFIREYYPSPYSLGRREPTFILELEISVPAVRQFLKRLPGYESGGAALLTGTTAIVGDSDSRSARQIEEALRGKWVGDVDPSSEGGDGQASSFSLSDGTYLMEYAFSEQLNVALVVYVPENEVMGPIQKYKLYLWLISLFALAILVIFAYWIYRIIHQPLRKLVGAFRKIESGVMRVNIQHSSRDEFHYLYGRFNDMVAHLNKLIFEVYEQKIHLQQAELKQLQAQINPHFLYNSFYLLYRMTKAKDFEHATMFTKFLGDYFQYITRNGADEVMLGDEIQHVKAYTEIQSIRFRGRIFAEFVDVPERIRSLTVPRLILQPLIENAYQHGFDLEQDYCLLRIRVYETQSEAGRSLLRIEAEDNGKGMSDAAFRQLQARLEHGDREMTGLMNVHRRLRLKFGSLAGLAIQRGRVSGLIATVVIPLNEGPEAGGEAGVPEERRI
ncbi:sensor histidine kinase [Cohnella fermenti]|uniref:HAMP domain-containing protein n=1 Tax=Cohnella fermenti TaxID=2565925 RepID=A0A4S4BP79_9BACL|nr:histidine kinase [Cohnella fermenti]THF76670.1 HAMP domain-containing protein [Cohnella fermenti]